jgi:hypothetical protein
MSYTQSVLASAPVGYWPLDEETGTLAHDVCGRRHHGAYQNGPALGGPGPFGDRRAAVFNGVDQFVVIRNPHGALFSQPTSGAGLSIECWVRPDALAFDAGTSGYAYWLGKGETGAQEWAFRLYSALDPLRPNRMSCYAFNPVPIGGRDLGAGAYVQEPLTEGDWIYIVGTLDAGDASDLAAGVTIFRNGARIEGPSDSPGARYANPPHWEIEPAATPSPVRVATRDLTSFFTGAVAQVAIYPRVLAADEVQAHYDAAVAEGLT